MTTRDTITQFFENVLQRAPTTAELAVREALVANGGTLDEICSAIVNSVESQTFAQQVIRIYQSAFGRKPDAAGLDGWVNALRDGTTTSMELIDGFVHSAEWAASYGSTEVGEPLIQGFYQNMLGREASAQEVADWIASGDSIGEILIGVANSAEAQTHSAECVVELQQAACNVADPSAAYTGQGSLFNKAADPLDPDIENPGGGGPGSGPTNNPPMVVLENTETELPEDTFSSSPIKVANIVITDDGLGVNVLGLTGDDAALFEIVGSELFLRVNTALDFEGGNSELDVTVTVDDATVGATPDASAALTITVTDIADSFELSEIEESSDDRGFVINGVSAFDFSGVSVSSAGDVNGDGLDDLIVGAPYDDPNGDRSGASFVVFGKADGSAVELSAVEDGTGGFVINGVSERDYSGRSVSSAGDVNGDGLDDLIVGAPRDDPNVLYSGASFVVFGKTDGTAVDLSAVEDGTGGFVINGVAAYDFSGTSVSSAGDVNGDGLDDLIVGSYSGAGFVVFGKTGGTAVELSAVEDGTGGFVINGVSAGDYSGFSVSSAGDVNGDGLDDLIVGAAFGDDPNGGRSGASFVVFGKTDGTAVDLSAVEAGTGGFVINGVSANDQSGRSVSSAGDVNGDGFDDLIVGAWGDDPNGLYSGASFVVFGKTDGTKVDLSAVQTGTGGFVINGVSVHDQSGFSVSSAGDVNGDGLDDLIVGAPYDGPNGFYSGASFVVFGKTDGTAVDLSAVEAGTGGFVINGVSAFDQSGRSVSSAGDVNGDGFDDLIVGARGDDPNGESSGASFVIFGGDDIGVSAATLVGTDVGETLTGTAGDDRIIAGRGDDIVIGGGGVDVLRGGAGDDILAVGDLSFARVDGGNGVDTLRIDGTGLMLDLPTVPDPGIVGIERIDLHGGGNSVVLDKLEVLRLSDTTNTLRVLGDGTAGDAMTLVGDWFFEQRMTDAEGTFDIVTDGLARIEMQVGLEVSGSITTAAIELSLIQTSSNSSGFVINGVSAYDRSGRSVSSAGDVNGDGLDDLIVGAWGDDPNDFSSGASFVVFGKADGTAVELSEIEKSTDDGGFVINGVSAHDWSGYSVSSAGDVNGDGLDDLIVGARYDDPNGLSSGASFVVFGKTGGTAVELSEIEKSTDDGGFVINGVSANDQSGFSVSSAGDVNGDGLDDLIVGAYRDEPHGERSGASFVVFGKTDGATVKLSDVGPTTGMGTGGFVINGVSAHDGSGRSVSSAGDVNGDGLDDLIVGAWGDDPNGDRSGASFVVFGKADGTAVELSEIEKSTDDGGFVINGVSAHDWSGRSVSSAGDVNGDGLDDLIVGAYRDDPNGDRSGASFVVFGKTGGTAVDLLDVEDGTGGFVINGVSALDRSGLSVSSAGDVNGDGLDDLIVGAYGDDPNGLSSGASFVVFGKTGDTAVDLLDVEAGTGGFVINGVSANDRSGTSVSSAGDVNGDGFDDLIVGAPYDDPNGDRSGASFVIFGGDDIGVSAATLVGTDVGEILTGTAGDDRIIAGRGDDIVIGGGGNDYLVGAMGNDTFVFADGSGDDIIKDFGDGVELIDLSAFGIADFASIVTTPTNNASNTKIQLDGDDSVTLIGVGFAELSAADFIFT